MRHATLGGATNLIRTFQAKAAGRFFAFSLIALHIKDFLFKQGHLADAILATLTRENIDT